MADWLRQRTPGLPVALCILGAVAVVGVALVDLERTRDDVPDRPIPCEPSVPGCKHGLVRGFEAQRRASDRLAEDYEERLPIYLLAALAMIGAATGLALRGAPPEQRERVWGNLGIAGVVGLIACVFLLLALEGREPPLGVRDGWFLVLPGAMIVVAVCGTIASRVGGRAPLREEPPVVGQALAAACLALAALALAFAAAFGFGNSGCDNDGESGLVTAAFVTGGLALLCGTGALFYRRWIAALVTLLAMPVGFVLLLIGSCLS